MAREFVKIYLDFEERVDELSDAEKGALLLAMVRYANSGVKPEMTGNERFAFGSFRAIIDRDIQSYDAKAENGKKGGRPAKANPEETEPENAKPKETEKNLTKPNETENNLNRKSKELRVKSEELRVRDKELTGGADAPRAPKPAGNPLSALAPEVQTAFRDFVAMRVKMRKPLTDRAIALNVTKLLSIAGSDPATQIAVINQTIEHSWQGFYPLKAPEATARSGTTIPETSNPFLRKLMELEAQDNDST